MNNFLMRGALALAATLLMVQPALAQAAAVPLKLAELTQCASHVQQLRSESARINQLNERMDAQRSAINQQSQALNAQAAQLPRDDLKAHLDLRQRRDAHNNEARSFNTQIEQVKRDIVALNAVRDQYDRDCDARPYRRGDLQQLPAAAQQAMRSGMDDVDVPYLPPGYALTD